MINENKVKIQARMWEIIQINNQLNIEYQKLYQEFIEIEAKEAKEVKEAEAAKEAKKAIEAQ